MGPEGNGRFSFKVLRFTFSCKIDLNRPPADTNHFTLNRGTRDHGSLQGLSLNHHMLQGHTFGAFLKLNLHMQPDPIILILPGRHHVGKRDTFRRKSEAVFNPKA